jgi:ABC-type branched-subunit amino acid transport system substrate-binding protein
MYERPEPPRRRGFHANARWAIPLFGALLIGNASTAAGDNISIVRDLASRLGPIIGSALACQNIARPRVQVIIDKFQTVIQQTASNDSERDDVARLFDRYVSDGRGSVMNGKVDCRSADRQLAEIEQSIGVSSYSPSIADAIAPPTAQAATAPTQALPPANVHGVTDREIRFGSVVALSGAAKENGRQLKMGIEAAFGKANDSGGVNGRLLKLITYDDGYDPSRTLAGMKQLYEKDNVFGFIGNQGTPTAAIAAPYALEHHALFYAPHTGAPVTRNDPPDRYVFNYKPSYVEEADQAVRYLLKIRKIPPRQIAVFGQNDAYGDSGYNGVARAYRALGINDNILKLTYPRNTVDVDDAVNTLRLQKVPIRAIVTVGTYRPVAKFIEKTHDLFPGMIYTSVSAVGPSSLSDELTMLGPRFTENVIVTQAVPAVSGYSSTVLDYKNALQKYFPGEKPDYISLEGFVATNVLIDALRRCGPQLDTEKLVDVMEATKNLDLGLGTPLNFGRGEHQASHKVWGTMLDQNGVYQSIDLE